MGLYSNARKLERAREKERETHSSIIDYSPRDPGSIPAPVPDSVLVTLAQRISSQIDLDSRFTIVSVSINKVIDCIRKAAPETKKNDVPKEVVSFIMRSASDIGHPFYVSDDAMVVVFQSAESVDMELFVHQLYNSLRNYFAGCPADGSSVLKSRARTYPTDGGDMARLLQEVL